MLLRVSILQPSCHRCNGNNNHIRMKNSIHLLLLVDITYISALGPFTTSNFELRVFNRHSPIHPRGPLLLLLIPAVMIIHTHTSTHPYG
jgi:hypothetical protein